MIEYGKVAEGVMQKGPKRHKTLRVVWAKRERKLVEESEMTNISALILYSFRGASIPSVSDDV